MQELRVFVEIGTREGCHRNAKYGGKRDGFEIRVDGTAAFTPSITRVSYKKLPMRHTMAVLSSAIYLVLLLVVSSALGSVSCWVEKGFELGVSHGV
jgi:hypothetical protein